MQVSPISTKTNAAPNFGALVFQIDHNTKSKKGFFEKRHDDRNFRDEFLGSIGSEDRRVVERMEKTAKKNGKFDIVIERRPYSEKVCMVIKNRKTEAAVGTPTPIGIKKRNGAMIIDPQKLRHHLGRYFASAEMLKKGGIPQD